MTDLVIGLFEASARFLECVPPSEATSLELGLWMRGWSSALAKGQVSLVLLLPETQMLPGNLDAFYKPCSGQAHQGPEVKTGA